MTTVLDLFSPAARAWFSGAFPTPTEVQDGGWRSVAAGQHTLMSAPTGSGKTLAAFFWCIDRLSMEPVPAEAERCRVLYVSPLKALTVDIERNLQAPLRGIALQAGRMGLTQSPITVAIRTGDTPPRDRRQIERHPPDILITTPESLFLLLTSAARQILPSIRWVSVDEIHSMAETKRGAHLALSLERLTELIANATPTPTFPHKGGGRLEPTPTLPHKGGGRLEPQRIGLSATQRPLTETAKFLGGASREVTIIDAGRVKPMEITVEVPVEDMSDLERGTPSPTLPTRGREFEGALPTRGRETFEEGPRRSIWPAIHPRILELVRQHRSTIIFVNSRRLAERLAAAINELAGEDLVRAHHGSIAKEQRLLIEDALKAGRLPGLVATSSLELGIDMGAVDLVIQVESPTSVASGIQRIGRAGHSVGEPSKGTIFPKYRGDLLETAVVVDRMLRGEIETTRVPRNLLDDGKRVGELDEEMVYEMRPGETFVLGATTWRVADITPSQVMVTPAPGEPGRIAFWHGDALGRPVEVGRAMGAAMRELTAMEPDAAVARL